MSGHESDPASTPRRPRTWRGTIGCRWTIDHDIMAITGRSMAAHARPVDDRAEAERILRMLPSKYPEQTAPLPLPMPPPDDVRIFRVTPVVISVLDYTKGFGHTDLVLC